MFQNPAARYILRTVLFGVSAAVTALITAQAAGGIDQPDVIDALLEPSQPHSHTPASAPPSPLWEPHIANKMQPENPPAAGQ